MKPSGPNLLDEPLKDFIVIPANLPWKGVKRLATSGERVNHDSWVKMYNISTMLNLVYEPCPQIRVAQNTDGIDGH